MNALSAPNVPHTLLPQGGGVQVRDWTVCAQLGSIASTAREEELASELSIKMPGMLFDDSFLRLTHAGGFQISFRAEDALRLVGPVDPTIRVSAAKVWDNRPAPEDVEIGVLKNASDWTFTTPYAGDVTFGRSAENKDANGVRDLSNRFTLEASIDYDVLRRQDIPILYFNQIILFEDELDDNGTASFRVRVRVHPDFFFVLARFFLRVDGVLVRVRDTRYFHRFGSSVLVREQAVRECRYEDLPASVTREALRDPDMIANMLPVLTSEVGGLDITAE